MTDTTTATRTLVKGYRPANGPATGGATELYGIRDMSATRGPDVAVFDTAEARDAALASPETLYLSLTSDEHGGNWRSPLTWESPDVDWATAEEAVPETREAQAAALAAMRRRESDALAELERYKGYYNGALATSQEHEQKLRRLWEALKEQAVERDWCSEFEEFVNANDGEQYVELSKTVSVTLEIEVNWRDTDDESELASAIYNMERWSIESSIRGYEEV